MLRPWRFVWFALLVGAGWLCQVDPSLAAPAADDRVKLRSADTLVKKANHLFSAKKYQESADAAREAQELLGELEKSDSQPLAQPLAALRKNLSKVHDRLKAEKVALPDLPAAGLSAQAGKPGKPARREAATDKISFASQVAPILVSRCGKCHVQGAKGGVSMSSYAELMQGGKNGIVVQAGSGKGSRIYEVIESGDMPRGGGEVPAAELALLVRWIDEGAEFDGSNATQPIDSLTPVAGGARQALANAAPARPPAKGAKGKPAAGEKPSEGAMASADGVSFARDIAPVLVEHCVDCHGERNPRARLNLSTFAGLMAGGENDSPITAGKPEESLLVQKLHGKADGKRMPLNRPPLASDVIARFEKWIAGGAKFDGRDQNMSLARLAAVVKAQSSTHEQLSSDRAALAGKNWHLVLPDAPADHTESEHFVIYGNVGGAVLADIDKEAEAQVSKLEKMLKIPTGEPLIKGRLTIYVFARHFDYGEIGQMLENHDIPAESRGHWQYDIVDAYAAIVPPSKKDDYSLDALLAEQITAVYVANQGTIPHWFADGSGKAVAAKINPKDSRVRQWETRLGPAMAKLKKPTDILENKLSAADGDALAYGFVKALMSKTGPYSSLLAALHSGMPFEAAFDKAYGASPNDAVAAWVARGGKRW